MGRCTRVGQAREVCTIIKGLQEVGSDETRSARDQGQVGHRRLGLAVKVTKIFSPTMRGLLRPGKLLT